MQDLWNCVIFVFVFPLSVGIKLLLSLTGIGSLDNYNYLPYLQWCNLEGSNKIMETVRGEGASNFLCSFDRYLWSHCGLFCTSCKGNFSQHSYGLVFKQTLWLFSLINWKRKEKQDSGSIQDLYRSWVMGFPLLSSGKLLMSPLFLKFHILKSSNSSNVCIPWAGIC